MEIDRQTSREIAPEERIKNFNEFHIPLHCDEQQAQGARCMDCGVPFCQSGMMIGGMASGCPLNNLIPEWNDLVYQGRWDLAAKRLIATNRYPEFTSRACTCGMATGSAVTVKENERAIVEYGYESGAIHAVPPPARTGKRVAVVGTGPSGLSVADLLNKRGHKVTMYERADRVGGLLMYGIPNMKLEKWVIDRRVKILKDEGIEFITNADVGRDVSAEELKENYDAVVLCCGAKKPRDIGVPGRDAEGICFAVDYLTSVTKSLLDSQFADGKAIDTGQHHIQQDQVKRLMQGGIQSCGSIRGNGHGVSAQLQIVPFDGRNVGIIFHNKNSFQLHITLPLPLAAASRYAVLHREHSPPGHFRPFAASIF